MYKVRKTMARQTLIVNELYSMDSMVYFRPDDVLVWNGKRFIMWHTDKVIEKHHVGFIPMPKYTGPSNTEPPRNRRAEDRIAAPRRSNRDRVPPIPLVSPSPVSASGSRILRHEALRRGDRLMEAMRKFNEEQK